MQPVGEHVGSQKFLAANRQQAFQRYDDYRYQNQQHQTVRGMNLHPLPPIITRSRTRRIGRRFTATLLWGRLVLPLPALALVMVRLVFLDPRLTGRRKVTHVLLHTLVHLFASPRASAQYFSMSA